MWRCSECGCYDYEESCGFNQCLRCGVLTDDEGNAVDGNGEPI